MNQQPAWQQRRGSDLVVLVVLGAIVLGVIAAGATHPGLTEKAHKERCLSHVSQLAKAMRLYSLDYNEYMFFGRGDAFSPPLWPGHYGQGYYLKKVMKNYVPSWGIWHCPSDEFAKKDFSSDGACFGSFTYQKSGIGYTAIPHADSTDPGIQALHQRLLRDYGADHMRVEHNESSYLYIPTHSEETEGRPTYIDRVARAFRPDWGAYGYWDINPSTAYLFCEDLSFHTRRAGGPFGSRTYGKTYGYRDGHAVFHTWDARGVNNYGPLREDRF